MRGGAIEEGLPSNDTRVIVVDSGCVKLSFSKHLQLPRQGDFAKSFALGLGQHVQAQRRSELEYHSSVDK